MYEAILIVVEAGPASRQAVIEGVGLARIHKAEVVFFSVLQRVVEPVLDMPMAGALSAVEFELAARQDAQRLLAAAEAVARRAGVPSRSVVGSGADDAEDICEAARSAGCRLVVVGSEGRNAVVRLLGGSVIPRLITLSTLPVMIVRESTLDHDASLGSAHDERLEGESLPAAEGQPLAHAAGKR